MTIGQLVALFFDTSGPGGVIIVSVLLGACLVYWRLTRWIIAGGAADSGGANRGAVSNEDKH